MDIKEIEKEIEEVKSRLNNLENILGEMKKEEGNVQWVPEYGDDYCCIVSGAIKTYNWYGSIFDYSCLEIGNVFKSAEEAEFMVEKLKVIRELNRYSCRFKKGFEQYGITYNYDKSEVSFGYLNNVCDYATICYESQETVQKAIKEVGEERIKKYLFGVEE